MTSMKEDSLPDLPGIDIRAGLDVMRDNVKLYRKLLLKFRDGRQNYIQELLDAGNAGDLELIFRIVHTIKGVAGNLGMTDVYQASLSAEVARKENPDNFESSLDELVDSLRTVFDGLSELQADEY